ncbi:2OG-Fe(II) oxygenase [Maricaulaceae bacterium MS644]
MNAVTPLRAPPFGSNLTHSLIEGLAQRGWAHAPDALDPELVADLRAEAEFLDAAGETHDGRIGRRAEETTRLKVRKTRIAWLDGSSPAQKRYLAGAEILRRALNEAFYLGLFEYEAHFAVYPPGGFYARHLDAFRLARGAGEAAGLGPRAGRSRVVSMVTYLNRSWAEPDGGKLALWDRAPDGPDGRPDLKALDSVPPAAEIAPEGGGVVLMLSEDIPHEVRVAHADRYAIAGWFRVNASIAGGLDPAL